jgi:hypothetical protein
MFRKECERDVPRSTTPVASILLQGCTPVALKRGWGGVEGGSGVGVWNGGKGREATGNEEDEDVSFVGGF